jgi:hypothetical protein
MSLPEHKNRVNKRLCNAMQSIITALQVMDDDSDGEVMDQIAHAHGQLEAAAEWVLAKPETLPAKESEGD